MSASCLDLMKIFKVNLRARRRKYARRKQRGEDSKDYIPGFSSLALRPQKRPRASERDRLVLVLMIMLTPYPNHCKIRSAVS